MRMHWMWSVVCALLLCACSDEPHGAAASEGAPDLEDAGSGHWNEGPSEEGPGEDWLDYANPCEDGPSEEGPCEGDPGEDEPGYVDPCADGPSEEGPCEEDPGEDEPGYVDPCADGPSEEGPCEPGEADPRDEEPPRGKGCARTQGYWKNHGWGTVVGMMIGSAYYTEEQARAILATPPEGDASLILAHQLIAALLNVASGASPHGAIADAQEWMRNNGSRLAFGTTETNAARARAIELNELLTAYNEGRTGVLHCDVTGGGGPPSAPPSEEPPY